MFTLPTIVLFVSLGILFIAVVVLFLMVAKLKKRLNGMALTIVELQEQASSEAVFEDLRPDMASGSYARLDMAAVPHGRPSAAAPREMAGRREVARTSIQDKQGHHGNVAPSAQGGSPSARPTVLGAKNTGQSTQAAAPVSRAQATGAAPMTRPQATNAAPMTHPQATGMTPMARPQATGMTSTARPQTTSQAPRKGRGKPVIPFGEDRTARERAYNKYASEAVEQDIAPDSIDFSKVASQLNINRGKGSLGVYDASNARRYKGNPNRR